MFGFIGFALLTFSVTLLCAIAGGTLTDDVSTHAAELEESSWFGMAVVWTIIFTLVAVCVSGRACLGSIAGAVATTLLVVRKLRSTY
ncbi:MAG TPA: hypothetical protein V6C81_02640 [Planktothrix sp.]